MQCLIHIINDEGAFAKLEREWNDLIEKAGIGSPFLTFDWMHTWWQQYKSRLDQPELFIITARNQDSKELIAILPLFSHLQKRNVRVMRLIGTVFESSDYLDVISDPGKKAAVLKKIFADQAVQNDLGATDVLMLENVNDEAAVLIEREHIANLLNTTVYHYRTKVCPYLVLPKSYEAFTQTLSRNFRSVLGRSRRKFEKSALQITVVQNVEELDEAIYKLFELHRKRFDAKNMASKFDFEKRGAFHRAIAEVFLKRGWLQLYLIEEEEKVVGALYCYRFKDTLFYVQGGFDPAYSRMSLGNVIMARAIEDAINRGLRIFDFMRGSEPYKKRWTKEEQYLHRLVFPLSFKARLLFFAEDVTFQSKRLIKKVLKKEQ